MNETPKLTLDELASLISEQVLVGWDLPPNSPNRGSNRWTVDFVLNSDGQFQVKLAVQNINGVEALELAKRLEARFTIQHFEMRKFLAKYTLGHDWMRDTEKDYDESMRNAPVMD